LDLFPKITVETKVYVEEEKEILETDIVTLKVKVIRQNLGEKEGPRFVHSLRFPFCKEEKWHVYVANDKQEILFYKLMHEPKKVMETSWKFKPEKAEQIKWKLYVKSDCYRGLD